MDLFTGTISELVKPYMTKAVPVDEDSLTACHAAMRSAQGIYHIPK